MDERLKAGPGLRREILKEDAHKDHDTRSKNLFKFRTILAVILHLCVPEFRDMTSVEVINYIEKGTISDLTEVSEGETVRLENSESKPNNEKTLFFDILFSVLLPESNTQVSVGLKINLEIQKTLKSLDYPLEYRGIYYLARLISSQLNYIDKETNYGPLKKVYSIWICTSDIPEIEKNSVVRYRMVGEKLYGKDFTIPTADLLELIIIKLGDVKSFQNDDEEPSDDILEFLYGIYAYHSHPQFFERYVDLDNSEEAESIRKELNAMYSTGDILFDEGRAEGREEGRAEGIEIGLAQGKAEDRAEMLQYMDKASQLRKEGVTDIEKYREAGIPDDVSSIFISIKTDK